MKYIKEMAKADLENVDLNQEPDKIASKYIENYKKRTGKDFSKQAAAALKKLLNNKGYENTEEVVKAAKQQAGVSDAESRKEQKQKSDEKMRQAVKGAAKRAADAYQEESFRDKVKRYL